MEYNKPEIQAYFEIDSAEQHDETMPEVWLHKPRQCATMSDLRFPSETSLSKVWHFAIVER